MFIYKSRCAVECGKYSSSILTHSCDPGYPSVVGASVRSAVESEAPTSKAPPRAHRGSLYGSHGVTSNPGATYYAGHPGVGVPDVTTLHE